MRLRSLIVEQKLALLLVCGTGYISVVVQRLLRVVLSGKMFLLVIKGATLGANCTIVCGNNIVVFTFVGAGAIVNKSVPGGTLVVGVPERQVGRRTNGYICA